MNEENGSLAKQWAAKMPTKEFTLPSGMTVEVKESKFRSLALMNIPTDSLRRVFEKGVEGTPEGVIQALPVIRQLLDLVKMAVASPKIVDGPTENEDEIALSDIPDKDIEALIWYVVRGDQRKPPAPPASASVTDPSMEELEESTLP